MSKGSTTLRFGECFARLRRPGSVAAALQQLVPVRLVRDAEAGCTQPGEVLERLAEQQGYSKLALLHEVAALLDMQPRTALHIPSIELLGTIAATPSKLCESGILPQENHLEPQLPILAVADPASARCPQLRRFRQELCLHSACYRTWSDLNGFVLGLSEKERAERQLVTVLQRLARDALQLGASEVFLGIPAQGAYEIHTSSQVYRGTLAPSLSESLNHWLPASGARELVVDRSADATCVRVSRATGGKSEAFILRIR